MHFPVEPEDVQIVPGASGRGLQVRCVCGAVNWNHLEIQESLWSCRNCGRVFTQYFPGLVVKVLAREKAAVPAESTAAPQPAS
jgi:hypothetical protein